MNRRNLTILLAALLMIGGTAFFINRLRSNQRLTKPGIMAREIPGSPRMELFLPVRVLDYDSVPLPTEEQVLNGLPQDTSFVRRQYARRPNEWPFWMNIVLMGTDRTSIHKPEFCLRGQGWDLDGGENSYDMVHVKSPHPYDLQVRKILSSRDVLDKDGKQVRLRAIYVFWFVADNDLTASHWARFYRMSKKLVMKGELERWAYVSVLGVCRPGEEDATYARMKDFIANAVPQFQLATNPAIADAGTVRTASR